MADDQTAEAVPAGETEAEGGSPAPAETEGEGSPADWGEDITPKKDGGVYKKILTEGKGQGMPLDGDEVFVHYTGRLLSGEVFDSSIERDELFKFKLGAGQVITGWDVGVATMSMNEKCVLTCKPDYAYGEEGSPPKIPPNSVLQFEVELFYWRGEDLTKDGGVLKSVVTKGEGYSTPVDGTTCHVHVRGIYDGRTFEEGDATFEYGEGSESGILQCVEMTVGTMKVKESTRIIVQPQYAYGDTGLPDVGVPPNAELVYEIRLNSFQKAKESFEYDTPEERQTDADALKAKGTTYFKAGKFPLAQKLYSRAEVIVKGYPVLKDDDIDPLKDLRVALHLNLAACHLKLNEPGLAIEECDKVLLDDKSSVKAYFRRGQARQMLQDYNESIQDFQEVLRLEPANKAAQTQVSISRAKVKSVKERERKRYANMFQRLAEEEEKPDTKEESTTKPLTDDKADESSEEASSGDEPEPEPVPEPVPAEDA